MADDLDVYGERKKQDKFENNDPFDQMPEDEADFQRLENGMVVNEDRE